MSFLLAQTISRKKFSQQHLVAPYITTRSLSFKPVYSTSVTVKGGRNGHVKSDDGLLDLHLAAAKSLGGSGDKTNPEQLFAAGYAACFEGAMNVAARNLKLNLPENTTVTGVVHIGPKASPQKGFQLAVELKVKTPGLSKADITKLVEETHLICPYSHAVHGNIEVKDTILE